MGTTTIEWATKTLNPVRARDKITGKKGWFCIHKSPECEHCYAEARNIWIGNYFAYTAQNRSKVDIFLDDVMLLEPFRWRDPQVCFWGSMTDLFGRFVPLDVHWAWLDKMMAVCSLTPQHKALFLTKWPDAMREYQNNEETPQRIKDARHALVAGMVPRLQTRARVIADQHGGDFHWPLPNVWLGTSIGDRRRWKERFPEIVATSAAHRFISFEPLLENIAQEVYSGRYNLGMAGNIGRIDLGIIGGESGPDARETWLPAVRALAGVLNAHGVLTFIKQLGKRPNTGIGPLHVEHEKGGDPAEWPQDLRKYRRLPA